MSKLEEAKEILSSLKVPAKQQNGMCCCVLLAMANLTEEQAWGSAANNWIRIHDVIAFANSNYGTTYAENSRETFRKQAMHHFRNAAFIEDNGKVTNSPNYRYRLTDEMLRLIQSFGTADWERSLARFMENHDSLVDLYASKRTMRKMPVKINGEDFTFSPGKHNQLQKATTDGLLQKAKEISERPSPRELDMLLSAGEQMSAALGAMTLRSIGVEAVSLCAWQIPIETDGTHGNAEIELIDTARIRKELAEGYVVVAAGFQGVDERGDITTLGRGGSDTSAVALAAALKADELIIYTDVDGIFSSDPRICQNAVRREVISYDDMLLLAQKGAQVLHDRSVALAQAGGVPITVRSCREGGAGSIVCETDEDASVVGVTQKKSGRSRLAAITAVGGALPSIEKEKIAVTALERAEITVFAVAAGERFMSFYVLRDDAERALQLVHDALIAAKE